MPPSPRQLALAALLLIPAVGRAQTLAAPFAGSYTAASLGGPGGVPANFGGLTFLNANTLLLGGAANGSSGGIYQVGLTRGADNRITGFASAATLYASAPQIDGGLTFGPGGVLFYTGYPDNTVRQLRPGSTSPDRVDNVNALIGSSVGGLAFIPTGFGGAGQLVLLGYNSNQWRRTVLSADGSGTYSLAAAPGSSGVTLSGGLEGLAFVPVGSTGFAGQSVLVSEYGAGVVSTYQLDANGDPIVGSRQAFVTGLSGAEGAVIDPVTGDFLFSTFGGSNQLVRVSGFAAPPTAVVPEPSTWALLGAGLLAVAGAARRRTAQV